MSIWLSGDPSAIATPVSDYQNMKLASQEGASGPILDGQEMLEVL